MAKFYTAQEIADLLSVTKLTVLGWIKEGRIKAVKLSSRNYRISEDELKDFIAKHTSK